MLGVLTLPAVDDRFHAGALSVRTEYSAGDTTPDTHRYGGYVAVEVKRRATLEAVDQLSRYLEVLRLDSSLGEVRGILVALTMPPQVKKLCWQRGIKAVAVDYDELRGLAPTDLRLF